MCTNILDRIKIKKNLEAVYLLLQCCLSNISPTMNDGDINNYIDAKKALYKDFRQHPPATQLQGCFLAAAVLFVKYFNNNE